MLHELLLALSGYPGSVFVQGEKGIIKVVPNLPFLHVSEVCLLNRLCVLGTYYKRFKEFIIEYSNSPIQQGQQSDVSTRDHLRLKNGLYIRAFCQGLDTILDPYRKALLQLEQEILSDPHLTPCHLQEVLEPYQLLFPDLGAVIEQIQYQRGHGCHLMEIVHQHCNSGKPMAKEAFQKILFVCHGVMYRQVTAWLLHGMLLDRHSEFFIHESAAPVQAEVTHYDDGDLGIGGVTGRQMREVMQLNEDGHLPDRPVYTHFAIRPPMLPSYIPVRVAERILFVGESVQMFENRKQNMATKYTDSVLQDKEDAFGSRLHQLRQEPLFSIRKFEDAIDEIRTCVAEHLWKLVVEDSNLVKQLNMLKDFFLLGRGELFLTFIDHAQMLLKTPPTSTTEHDVNLAFRQAAHKVLLEDDTSLSQFQLTISTKATGKSAGKKDSGPAGKIPGDTGWSCLGMTYTVKWPLHTLINQAALEKYNTLFCFLLNIKRVQLELQQCWALQMQRKHAPKDQATATKWRLRSHMAFLIDNLQYYLQVDVLETQFTQLIDKINATRDFEAVRLAHDYFLISLHGQCFLLTKPVSHCLNEIVEICHSFSVLLITHGADMTERELAQMGKLSQGFNRQSSLLFKILSNVLGQHQTSPYLAQFLLRLDYNKYYSRAEGALAT